MQVAIGWETKEIRFLKSLYSKAFSAMNRLDFTPSGVESGKQNYNYMDFHTIRIMKEMRKIMIVDLIDHWTFYAFPAVCHCAFEFLASLDEDAEEKKYPLRGEDIFARVMSYQTKSMEEAVLEAHRNYVDIQAIVRGHEYIDWYPVNRLEVKTSYDAVKDVEFYQHSVPSSARVELVAGNFALLYPQDAHMPQLRVGDVAETVKKVVLKVRVDLLRG
jgi:YhcH/YjgK/YiaL family protein